MKDFTTSWLVRLSPIPCAGAEGGVPGLHVATLAGSDRLITLALSRAGRLPLRFSLVRASQAKRSCAVGLD